MTDTVLERLLRRDRWVVGACLAVIAALAWGWLISMGAMDMGAMPMAPTYATQLGAAFVMWLVMMVAMTMPSIAIGERRRADGDRYHCADQQCGGFEGSHVAPYETQTGCQRQTTSVGGNSCGRQTAE